MSWIIKAFLPRKGISVSPKIVRTPTHLLSHRTYANEPSGSATTRGEPNATNIRDSPYSSAEASQVNASRSLDSEPAETKPTTAKRVSHPEQSGLGGLEEPLPSQENMKRPKEEPDHIKRQHVEEEGQKPLDPADDGYGAVERDPSK